MGLLDDAIREHLELKRRRGADPGELERQEREALGPVRRTRGDVLEDSMVDESGLDAGYVDNGEEGFAEAWADEPADPPLDEQGPELEEADSVESGLAVEPDTAAPATPAPPDPATAPERGGAHDEAHFLEQETVEHDVEAEHASEAEQDDMLEETPEFLQDTPDHDRLWFEQRPPRDFDLDG